MPVAGSLKELLGRPVEMEPALIPVQEAERLAALERYAILDTEPEAAHDRISETLCAIYGVPIATLTFIDRDRAWCKSACGTERRQVPRDRSLAAHAVHAGPGDDASLLVVDLDRLIRGA